MAASIPPSPSSSIPTRPQTDYILPSASRVEVAIDEAGRGSLIHDVVAAAVVMPSTFAEDDAMYKKIKDSKKLSPKKREELRRYIEQNAIAYGVGTASAQEIDERNILQATYLAMHRALLKVWERLHFQHIIVDGNGFKAWRPPRAGPDDRNRHGVYDTSSSNDDFDDGWVTFTCIPKGDATRLDIAAASILAKTHRDEMILKLVDDCPDLDHKYGLASNKGYGTSKHMSGIRQFGLSEYHRRTFTRAFAPASEST